MGARTEIDHRSISQHELHVLARARRELPCRGMRGVLHPVQAPHARAYHCEHHRRDRKLATASGFASPPRGGPHRDWELTIIGWLRARFRPSYPLHSINRSMTVGELYGLK